MNERINWMDWSKFLAVALTVPCHIPQTRGDQPVTYSMVFLLACLMFNSGYLRKPRHESWNATLLRYWHSLVIPYLAYNLLFYPYWLFRFYEKNGDWPTWSEALRPLWGTLLLQTNNSFACELNPVTWFIMALLVLHLLLEVCNRMRHGRLLMIVLCLLSMALYVVSKYNRFTSQYVLIGIFKALPFYYLGYLFRQHGLFRKCSLRKDTVGFLLTTTVSIFLFNYHVMVTNDFSLHMLSYFPTVLFGLLSFLYFCKMLDGIRSKTIVNYSNGTMVFIGLHWILVGFIRYGVLRPVFHVPSDYVYTPLEAYTLGILVTLLLYPIILFLQARMPWMLGKRRRG